MNVRITGDVGALLRRDGGGEEPGRRLRASRRSCWSACCSRSACARCAWWLATLLTLIVGLVLTVGFTARRDRPLQHDLRRLRRALHRTRRRVRDPPADALPGDARATASPRPSALRETARDVGTSLVLSATTTAIGFFAFVPTEFVGVAELGVISGGRHAHQRLLHADAAAGAAGRCASKPEATASPSATRSGRRALIDLPVRYPRAVRFAALALTIGLGAACCRARASTTTRSTCATRERVGARALRPARDAAPARPGA